MSRPIKKGFEFFPLDVNIFSDIKIKKLIKKHKPEAFAVYSYIVCQVFKDGYYIRFDSDFYFFISDDLKMEETYVEMVFNYCLEINLFNKDLFDENCIITSKGIQERYTNMCVSSKRTTVINEFNLLNVEETIINKEKTKVNSEFSTQRKKERKKESKETKPIIIPSSEFINIPKQVNSKFVYEDWVEMVNKLRNTKFTASSYSGRSNFINLVGMGYTKDDFEIVNINAYNDKYYLDKGALTPDQLCYIEKFEKYLNIKPPSMESDIVNLPMPEHRKLQKPVLTPEDEMIINLKKGAGING